MSSVCSFVLSGAVKTILLVNTLHVNLSVPVTAKFRVFPTVEKTVGYAKMLERAGAQIITCHGRIREQRGQNSVFFLFVFCFNSPYLTVNIVFVRQGSRRLVQNSRSQTSRFDSRLRER